jgi:hypothetical protein
MYENFFHSDIYLVDNKTATIKMPVEEDVGLLVVAIIAYWF